MQRTYPTATDIILGSDSDGGEVSFSLDYAGNTIIYGGAGSGKSTLLGLIGSQLIKSDISFTFLNVQSCPEWMESVRQNLLNALKSNIKIILVDEIDFVSTRPANSRSDVEQSGKISPCLVYEEFQREASEIFREIVKSEHKQVIATSCYPRSRCTPNEHDILVGFEDFSTRIFLSSPRGYRDLPDGLIRGVQEFPEILSDFSRSDSRNGMFVNSSGNRVFSFGKSENTWTHQNFSQIK